MTENSSVERSAFTRGLRALADYLESNPEIPVPYWPTVHVFPAARDWAGMCAEIDAVAARLGSAACRAPGGHYVTTRQFGPVEYRAVAIPPRDDSTESE